MCNAHRATVRALVIPILLAGVVWAQSLRGDSEPAPSQDVFAAWQANLSDAADRALAAAVADKAWMKGGRIVANDADRTSNEPANSVVHIRAAIQRIQQLRPIIEPILRQETVSPALSAVVLVESGGQPAVISSKGARGIWQFMPATARRYGLVVSPGKAERIDVVKSTQAAARYLRDLHDRFGSWPLALAAYNAGEDTVQRAIERTGATDFVDLRRSLPLETRNYVPGVLSAVQRIGGIQSPELKPGTLQSEFSRRVYASPQVRD